MHREEKDRRGEDVHDHRPRERDDGERDQDGEQDQEHRVHSPLEQPDEPHQLHRTSTNRAPNVKINARARAFILDPIEP